MTIEVAWADPDSKLLAPVVEQTPRFAPAVSEIIAETADKHGITVHELMSDRRTKKIAHARHEAMYRACMETKASYPALGRAFNRDHSSVMHGVRTHELRHGLADARKK